MKTLVQQLANYAAYHRDRRNIRTHFVGIPLIVVAVAILLSRPALPWGPLPFSPTALLVLAASIYYLLLDRPLGLVMTALMLGAACIGAQVAMLDTTTWLAWGIGLFVFGWVLQFIGHYYEGKKPAFVDDIMGLAIGPLFVVAEASFLLGLRQPLRAEIEGRAGPVH
ncbi:MAG TPA: DUF962 domain-containing protein [Rhodocyclaceae bacterium]|nr:DUF962 domain-containing protein [Rhodocyclaceae bacterium]